MVKQGYFDATIFIDGKYAGGIVSCASIFKAAREADSNGAYLSGFHGTRSDGKAVIRAFQFSQMETTGKRRPCKLSEFYQLLIASPVKEDISVPRPTPEAQDEMCTIRVKIVQTFRVGKCQHEKKKKKSCPRHPKPMQANSVVREDCKPAKYGIETG